MVSAPARIRVAEKYVNMRTQSFTRTHARALEEWKNNHAGSEDGYWEDFRRQLGRAEERYNRDLAAIEADVNSTFNEKRVAKNRLRSMYPAWSEEQERRFIEQYGDPRTVDRGTLLSLVESHRGQFWEDALRGGEQKRVEKTAWEMKFYDALVNPQDGSVPLLLDTPASPSVVGARDVLLPSPPTPTTAEPYVAPVLSGDPAIQRMVEDFAKNICPICMKPQKKLNRMHTDACQKKHEAAQAG